MGRHWAIVVGAVAAGVMALGAQMATAGEPDLQLSGPKKQDPQNDGPSCHEFDCDVTIKASCGDEECTARSKGKLTNVKNDKLSPVLPPGVIAPGETRNMGVELRRQSQRRQVRKALNEGTNVQAKVTVRAKDAAGNVAVEKRTIKIVKHAKG